MTKQQLLVGLGACLLVVLALEIKSVQADYPLSTKELCESEAVKEHCCSLEEGSRQDLQRQKQRGILQDALKCVEEILRNIRAGNLEFPKTCCKLPIFNLLCNCNGRDEFPLYRSERIDLADMK